MIATLAEKIPYPGSVEVLEALATKRATKFVVNWAYWLLNLKAIPRWFRGL